jgi:prenylcysteine alpha-carboxyl methylesterase
VNAKSGSILTLNNSSRIYVCRIYLIGQSAGAHIAACALMEQAVKESGGNPVSWSLTQIKAYFGLSGG